MFERGVKMGFSDNNASFKATFGEVYTVPGSGGGSSPVTSVNGKIGDVNLTASDVGAYTKEQTDNFLKNKANIEDVGRFIIELTITEDKEITDVSAEYSEIVDAYMQEKEVVVFGYYEDNIFIFSPVIAESEELTLITFSAALGNEILKLVLHIDNTWTFEIETAERVVNKMSFITDADAEKSPDTYPSVKAVVNYTKTKLATYATKEELADAIGEALEGEY